MLTKWFLYTTNILYSDPHSIIFLIKYVKTKQDPNKLHIWNTTLVFCSDPKCINKLVGCHRQWAGTKHGRTPENVCRLHIIADKFRSAPKKPGFTHAWQEHFKCGMLERDNFYQIIERSKQVALFEMLFNQFDIINCWIWRCQTFNI